MGVYALLPPILCVRACGCHFLALLTMCVSAVMNFQPIMEYWLAHVPRLKEEHGDFKGLLGTLQDELTKLCHSFARRTGWKTYSDHRPKHPGTKRTRDGWRRKKTPLERLESSDDSEEEGNAQAALEEEDPQNDGDPEFAEVMRSIGMDGVPGDVDEATTKLVGQHVQEFVRERLSPLSRIKDALAWWAAKEATWPMVAAVARHSLCVPVAATCSERGFSGTGHIVRSRRARLSDEKIEKLSHLSNNIDVEL